MIAAVGKAVGGVLFVDEAYSLKKEPRTTWSCGLTLHPNSVVQCPMVLLAQTFPVLAAPFDEGMFLES